MLSSSEETIQNKKVSLGASLNSSCFGFRCNHAHFRAMDWRNFTPKYSDCDHAYLLLHSAQVNKTHTAEALLATSLVNNQLLLQLPSL